MPSDSDRPQPSAGNHRLFADQVQKQYEHTGFGTAATLINGMILAFVLRGHVRRMELIVWLVCAVMVSALRLVLNGLYRRSPTKTSKPPEMERRVPCHPLPVGVLWGSTAIFLFPSDSFAHQAFIAFVSGGMVAGAIGAFTAVLSAFYLFSIPALLPICFRFFMLGSDIHIAMGAMVLLFLLINILTATRMHKDILALLALRYERSALIADLQQEVDQRKAPRKTCAGKRSRLKPSS